MSRLMTLIKKNLLRFYRNPKTLGFLLLVPIIYYALLGFIFGGLDFTDTTSTYNIGWVDNDNSTANYDYHPNFNLELIFNITNDINGVNLKKYNSTEEAQASALNGDIISYVVFPGGFESYLENRSKINIAIFNNDTSTSTNFTMIDYITSLAFATVQIFNFTIIPDSLVVYNIINNLDNFYYDGLLIINEGFFSGIDYSLKVNMSFLFRRGINIAKVYYIIGTVLSISNTYFQAKGTSSTILIPEQYIIEITNSSPIKPIFYEIYFLQTVSLAVQAAIENVIVKVISTAVNNNPAEIEVKYDKKSTVGRIVNNITFSAPGYLLYGPITILSFALIILTGEKKEGIYKRLASTEVQNYELILSNIISNILLIFMQFGIGALILSLFGWNPVIYSLLDCILGVVLTLFLFSFFILALSFALAPIFKDPDSAGGGVWIIIIPLAMISGIFVPVELFGDTMEAIVAWLPTRFAVVALQNLLLNGQSIFYFETLINLGLLALYSSVIFIIGIRAFNKFKN